MNFEFRILSRIFWPFWVSVCLSKITCDGQFRRVWFLRKLVPFRLDDVHDQVGPGGGNSTRRSGNFGTSKSVLKHLKLLHLCRLDTFEFFSLKTLNQSKFLKLLHLNLILGINHFEFLKVYFIKCEMLNRLGLKDLKLFQFSNRTQSLILIYLMSMRCFV